VIICPLNYQRGGAEEAVDNTERSTGRRARAGGRMKSPSPGPRKGVHSTSYNRYSVY
jgi:hypothetical protein